MDVKDCSAEFSFIKWEFSRLRVWRWLSSELIDDRPDDGDSRYLWNVGNFYQTAWRNNPEDSHFHILRHEKLKSHSVILSLLRDQVKRF
jgi:hypothetical protein